MPLLASFYGIVTWMYRPDHPPPHFHAQYGEHVAQIELGTWRVLNGSMPPRALRLVRQWARLHPEEPADNWVRAQALEPLVAIEPLENYRLRVTFNDGVVRVVDCSFLLHGTLGEPLRDLDYFRQVPADDDARTVVWPNGLDPAPELLHADHETIAAPRSRSATRA